MKESNALPISRHNHSICIQGLKEPTKNLTDDSQSHGRKSIPSFPECELRMNRNVRWLICAGHEANIREENANLEDSMENISGGQV